MAHAPLEVLIVEDNPNKKRKLFEKVRGLSDIFKEPEVVGSASEAVRRLSLKDFDLLILDVVVPFQPDGDPHEQHSIDLLKRIDGGLGGIRRPRHVLSISSVEVSADVASFFRGRPWGCVHYSEDSTKALDDVEHVGRWIAAQPDSLAPSACDALIVTALEEPEFTALEAAFGPGLGPLVPLDSTQLARFCEIRTPKQTLKVCIAFAPRMGPVASAVLCTKAIDQLRPRIILMAGICGAIGDKANIGDLIAAEASWDWQSGKFVDRGGEDFEIAPHQLNIPSQLRSVLIKLKRDAAFWNQFMPDAMTLRVDLPKLVIGPVATGSAVVADERVTKRIKEEQNKNVVGIDMETYAVYASAASADYQVPAVSLKAVSDRADKEKDDRYRTHAAGVSARCVVHMLTVFGDEVLPSLG